MSTGYINVVVQSNVTKKKSKGNPTNSSVRHVMEKKEEKVTILRTFLSLTVVHFQPRTIMLKSNLYKNIFGNVVLVSSCLLYLEYPKDSNRTRKIAIYITGDYYQSFSISLQIVDLDCWHRAGLGLTLLDVL